MAFETQTKEEVVIKMAGDSGDGMQLTGNQFTINTALEGHDLATFPDFPAEIRAPQGTIAGVSGFQIHFGSREIITPGDSCDVLVAMNAAALKANLHNLKPGAIVIINSSGFDKKNLRLSGYEDNPLENGTLDSYQTISMDITKLTRETLKDSGLGTRDADRSKNMFVLGFLYWMYDRDLNSTIDFLQSKFGKKDEVLQANIKTLKAGYNYGDTTETFKTRYKLEAATIPPGKYRSIMGNQAASLGLLAGSVKSGLDIFLGTYPITPASDILHQLSTYKHFGVKTFQAEDEIAGICASIGASYAGNLGITSTSGPGMALKTEAMGLAMILELPLVIVNIQRAGPSTGLPTKTEQADLLQAVYGRNGECPIPVIAASSPSNAFFTAFEAVRIALEYMTPVIFLSDGYIANGSEPWKYPDSSELPTISTEFASKANTEDGFMPYLRNEKMVREWAIPGTEGLEHRIGGLEKEDITGDVSYAPDNHEHMVKIRAAKVDGIADNLPQLKPVLGTESGKVLVIGWGSTFGSIKSAVRELHAEGKPEITHLHLNYIFPFQKELEQYVQQFDHILVPEINNGQLVKLIRDKFLVDARPLNKIKGIPFTLLEIKTAIESLYNI